MGKSPTIWMVSSGQSCTTCHSKQEIAARALIGQGLIENNVFATLYGATYDDTYQIAQFYDAQYADAMRYFSCDPESPHNLIQSKTVDYDQLPEQLRKIFGEATSATAVVMRNDKIYATGNDGRDQFNLYATPEVSAVRAACRWNREKDGVFASWEVDGDLYTTSESIGPLLFGEIGWTNIKTVWHVRMPLDLAHKRFDTRETVGNNSKVLDIVSGGYHEKLASIAVVRDHRFVNTAQPMWSRVLKANDQILYNGSAVSDAVLAERNTRTRFNFAAYDIETVIVNKSGKRINDEPWAPPVPLMTLGDFQCLKLS